MKKHFGVLLFLVMIIFSGCKTETVSVPVDNSGETEKLQAKIAALEAELLEVTTFRNLENWGANSVFQHETDKNKFYYTTEGSMCDKSPGFAIWEYDVLKAATYSSDIPMASRYLFCEDLDLELFRPVSLGLDGDKFVFTTTPFENSPGPCFSAWIGFEELYSIDVKTAAESDPKDVKKTAYEVSELKVKEEQAAMEECQKELN